MKNIFNFKISRGFTLVEMLIAVGLFAVVVSISMGALFSVFDANRRARSAKTVVDNLNLAVEDMARTVRFGDTYHCDPDPPPYDPPYDTVANCSNGGEFLAVHFGTNTLYEQTVKYQLSGGAIQKSVDQGPITGPFTNITAPETKIVELKFRTFGTDPVLDKNEQPYVILMIRGYVGEKPTLQSSFVIETMMSQRKLDVPSP